MLPIQFNTDKTIKGDQASQQHFSAVIQEALENFQSQISRIEVHLSDENGEKEGFNNIRCLLEARINGRQPIAVSHQADTLELAISGAIDKLSASLETIFGRLKNH